MAINVVTPNNLGADFITDASKYHSRSILSGSAAPVAAPPVTVKTWLWINTTTNKVTHYWNGSAWTVVGNTSIFVTIAQLRAFTPSDIDALPEVYIIDTNKEGIFKYDSTDTTTADNLGTVLVAGTARYKRVFDGAVRPEWFGALGDGTTDDSAAINAAIAASDKVILSASDYVIASQILINKSKFEFLGQGKFVTTIRPLASFNRTTYKSLVRIGVPSGQSPDNVAIKGMSIAATNSAWGNDLSGLEIEAYFNTDVYDCSFQGGNYTGTLYSGSTRNVAGVNVINSKHLEFQNCDFTNSYSWGVLVSGAAYDGLSFTNCDFDENQGDIIVTASGYVQDGMINGCRFGATYDGSDFGGTDTTIIRKNIHNTTSGGINRLIVDGCQFRNGAGTVTENTFDIVGNGFLRISNSRFTNTNKYAIVIRDACVVDITNNEFEGCGRNGTGAYTTASTNPDSAGYYADIFVASAFYGGTIEGNRTNRADGILAVVDKAGTDRQYLRMDFINNVVYSYGVLWGNGQQELITPSIYGVVANGVTNATTGLQALFASNRDVYIPKGIYLVNGEIEITGNVYCEHGAVFKVVDSYSGSLFNIKSKKHLHIKNLYIDATGATNNPLTGTPSITCIGLKIQGLWLSTIENFSMVFHSTSTSSSNIGIQMISSESTLGFGCYGVRIVNPYISRGGWGITTNKQTSETDAFITHLEITSGWIGSQDIGCIYPQYAYNSIFTNIGTDVIKLNTGIGYKIENCSQITITLGEYNIEPSTPDTAKIVSIDDDTCSFIDITAPRGVIASTIGGTEYSMRTAGALRLKPTTADGVYTEMRSDYAYGNSFVIEGNYDGDVTLRKILQYNTFDGLRTENVPLVTTTGVQVLTNKNYNKVSITEPATLATLTLADGSTLGLVGAFITTFNSTANTSVTLPISGTLATLANSEALTNKSINGVTLATGGSASLFLNQQGSYVAASGGGGVTQSVYHLTTDVSDSAGTLIQITPFTFSIVAGRKYKIELIGAYSSLTTTTGIILAVSTVTAGDGVIRGYMSGSVSSGTVATELKTAISSVSYGTAGSYITTTGANPINTPHAIEANLAFNCTTTGQLGFFFSTEVTSSLATLLAGTMVFVTEFA